MLPCEGSYHLGNIDSAVQEALQKCQVPGMALGVIVDDQIVLARGYGYRNVVAQLPVTEDTLFPIASGTKAFTAFLFSQLVDQGKVSWDDPVVRHLPEFRLCGQRTEQVTIRDLLAHRTGIPRHDALWVCNAISKEDILNLLALLEPMAELGQHFEYSNMMYAIAGMLFEKVSSQPWEEAIRERIFKPLQMDSSGVLNKSINEARPYVSFNGTIEEVPFCDVAVVNPGSGVHATVLDMLKWVQEQLSGRLVSPQRLQEMHSIQIAFPSKYDSSDIYKHGYGLGWFVGQYRGHVMVNHEGHRAGFFCDVVLLPKDKIGIVLLTNSGSDGRFAIASVRNAILDSLLNLQSRNWLQIACEQRQRYQKALRQSKENGKSKDPDKPLNNYVGSYHHPAYGTAHISLGSNLIFQYGRTSMPLSYIEKDRFEGDLEVLRSYGVSPSVPIQFILDRSGNIIEMHVSFEKFRNAEPVIFKKNQFPL